MVDTQDIHLCTVERNLVRSYMMHGRCCIVRQRELTLSNPHFICTSFMRSRLLWLKCSISLLASVNGYLGIIPSSLRSLMAGEYIIMPVECQSIPTNFRTTHYLADRSGPYHFDPASHLRYMVCIALQTIRPDMSQSISYSSELFKHSKHIPSDRPCSS